ncbi:MAG: general secretion pathway protein GspG [Acidobacteriota bacterium]|nr:general secretion pathway protein GspG [Acidobacteriota bacterium]
MPSRFYKILILILIAALTASCGALKSGHNESELKARENILKDDLFQMRKMIDQYAADRGKLPQSLDDLVKAGSLRQIPEDPITERPDWKLDTGEDAGAKGKVGLINIHSSSTEKSVEGKPYNEW